MDAATIVDCKDDHRFEVAQAVDMRAFPGAEFGPDADPRLRRGSSRSPLEQCEPGVERYRPQVRPEQPIQHQPAVGGDKAWKNGGERRLLCRLQLQGPGNQQLIFKGAVSPISTSPRCGPPAPAWVSTGDQPAQRRSRRLCGLHAMEVTGTVNLGERFPRACRSTPTRTPSSGGVHLADRRVPGAGEVARHDPDPDLQHGVVAGLGRRQSADLLQYRRHPGQRRMGHPDQHRQRAHCWSTASPSVLPAADPRERLNLPVPPLPGNPAGLVPVGMSAERFEELVSEARTSSADLAAAIDNVVVLVSDRHPGIRPARTLRGVLR